MRKVIASAPGKCILTGEHSVVYGSPALVVALNMRAFVEVKFNNKNKLIIETKQYDRKVSLPLDITNLNEIDEVIRPVYLSTIKTMNFLESKKGITLIVDSQIPPSSGLGSSAAVSVATIKAVSAILDSELEENHIFNISYESEKVVHGTPSGIDNAVSVKGGAIIYQNGKVTKINSTIDLPLVIGNTLKTRNTGVLVGKVRDNYNKYPRIYRKIIDTIGEITLEAKKCIENNDIIRLGELMNINQELLSTMGVSTKELELLINTAKASGAYGAKLTGAGGGGCMVAVCDIAQRNHIAKKIKEAGGAAYITKISLEGVRIEE
ncbi:MAG: mevalonate kinase [Candidatus Odinarchaeia archaeon]